MKKLSSIKIIKRNFNRAYKLRLTENAHSVQLISLSSIQVVNRGGFNFAVSKGRLRDNDARLPKLGGSERREQNHPEAGSPDREYKTICNLH